MSSLYISCNSSTPIWNSVIPSCKITGTNFCLWFWTRELLCSQYSVKWLTMLFQSVEWNSLPGSMSELVSPLFSLTPNRRAPQAHTRTPHRFRAPTATVDCASPCLSPGSSPLHLSPPTPPHDQSVATGGCRPNKWRQPRNTPPVVPNDVTVPRICKLFRRTVNVGLDIYSFSMT